MTDKNKSDEKQDAENPEFQNFQRLLRGTLAVPKKEVDKKRAEREQDKHVDTDRESKSD